MWLLSLLGVPPSTHHILRGGTNLVGERERERGFLLHCDLLPAVLLKLTRPFSWSPYHPNACPVVTSACPAHISHPASLICHHLDCEYLASSTSCFAWLATLACSAWPATLAYSAWPSKTDWPPQSTECCWQPLPIMAILHLKPVQLLAQSDHLLLLACQKILANPPNLPFV